MGTALLPVHCVLVDHFQVLVGVVPGPLLHHWRVHVPACVVGA